MAAKKQSDVMAKYAAARAAAKAARENVAKIRESVFGSRIDRLMAHIKAKQELLEKLQNKTASE